MMRRRAKMMKRKAKMNGKPSMEVAH
jgi:hypothetical protein